MEKLFQIGNIIQRIFKAKETKYDVLDVSMPVEKYLSEEVDSKIITSDHLQKLAESMLS